MRDIQITGKTIKKELIILLTITIISYLLNVFSIIFYKTLWTELYSSLFYVLFFAVALYLLLIPTRILLLLIFKILKKKQQIKSLKNENQI